MTGAEGRGEGLAALRALSEAATPGPWADAGTWWSASHNGNEDEYLPHPTVAAPHSMVVAETWRADRADAAFIAAAVNYVRALLAAPVAATALTDEAVALRDAARSEGEASQR